MIVKVGLLGASGRMGLEVAALLTPFFAIEGDSLELADAVANSHRLKHIEGVTVRTLAEPPRDAVHVWIDFSRPEASLRLLESVNVPVLVATTGFTKEEQARLEKCAERIPVLLAPNTSPGMNLLMRLLRELPAAGSLPFDLAVDEEHHRGKKDSPSGTTKALVETLEGLGYSSIPVTVTRGGSIRGNHTVKILFEEEELRLEHRVTDRSVFARGALLGAHFLARRKKPGIYRMDHVFSKELSHE
jgi:4-hydroxy-tetrahydrodipicolinate reductase